MRKKINFFYKYLISYLLLCAITIGIMGSVFYTIAVDNLQKEIESTNVIKLNQLKNMIDQRIKELGHIASRISEEPGLSALKEINYNDYLALNYVSEMKKYKANSVIVDNMFLYFRNENKIISSTGSFTYNTFEKYLYSFSGWDRDTFREHINNVTSYKLIKLQDKSYDGGNVTHMFAVLYPIPLYESKPFATIIFVIEESVLSSMIEDILGNFEGAAFIMDENKNVVVSNYSGFSGNQIDVSHLREASTGSDVKEIKVNGKKLSLVNIISNETNWSFITVIPTEQFHKHVLKLRNIVLGIALIMALFGIVFALIFSRSFYSPIKKLIQPMYANISQDKDRRAMDEFDLIETTVKDALSKNKELSEKIQEQKERIIEQTQLKLLYGKVDNKVELSYITDNFDIFVGGVVFQVLLIDYGKQNINIAELFNSLKKDIEAPGIQWNALEMDVSGRIAIVVKYEEPIEASDTVKVQTTRFVERILEKGNSITGANYSTGIGMPCENVGQLNRSFIEASAAIDYLLMKYPNKNIMFFDEMNIEGQEKYWYPAEEQMKFLQSLKHGDKAVALDSLGRILENIAQKHASLLMVRYICFDIINGLVKALNDMEINDFSKNVEEVMVFVSMEDLREKLERLTCEICSFVDNQKEKKGEETREKLITFIKENYRDNGLSLEKIADQFGNTVSYLSRFIKESIGVNFTDYVVELRINEVKRQLLETDKTVKEIVTDVGYIDISNFVRKFRSLEGITPGKYRERFKT